MDRQDLLWMTGLPLLNMVIAWVVAFGIGDYYYSEVFMLTVLVGILSALSAFVNRCIYEEMDDRIRSLRCQRDHAVDMFSRRAFTTEEE